MADSKRASLERYQNLMYSVANLAKISAVVLKGKYFPKTTLDPMKADVAAAYSVIPLKDLSTALDPSHVD